MIHRCCMSPVASRSFRTDALRNMEYTYTGRTWREYAEAKILLFDTFVRTLYDVVANTALSLCVTAGGSLRVIKQLCIDPRREKISRIFYEVSWQYGETALSLISLCPLSSPFSSPKSAMQAFLWMHGVERKQPFHTRLYHISPPLYVALYYTVLLVDVFGRMISFPYNVPKTAVRLFDFSAAMLYLNFAMITHSYCTRVPDGFVDFPPKTKRTFSSFIHDSFSLPLKGFRWVQERIGCLVASSPLSHLKIFSGKKVSFISRLNEMRLIARAQFFFSIRAFRFGMKHFGISSNWSIFANSFPEKLGLIPREDFMGSLVTGLKRGFVNQQKTNAISGSRYFLNLFTLAIIKAPIKEEIQYRMVIQDLFLMRIPKYIIKKVAPGKEKILDSKGMKAARIFLTATLFARAHLINKEISWAYTARQVPSTFVMGVFFGLMKESKAGLMGAIGMHMANNIIASLGILSTHYWLQKKSE